MGVYGAEPDSCLNLGTAARRSAVIGQSAFKGRDLTKSQQRVFCLWGKHGLHILFSLYLYCTFIHFPVYLVN